MSVVFDSSAVIAFLRRESGGEQIAQYLGSAKISAVNFAEIVTKLIDMGDEVTLAGEDALNLGLNIVPLDTETALLAGQLRAVTRRLGLSLGDRVCLALGIREEATVLTADRSWASLDLPCKVELIR